MEKVYGKIVVKAPPEKVFEFISEPANLPALIPVISSAKPTVVGVKATINISGMDFPVDFTKALWKENEGIGLRAELYGATVEIGVLTRAVKEGTSVEVEVGYDIPRSVLVFLPQKYKSQLEAGIDASLKKLKATLEAG